MYELLFNTCESCVSRTSTIYALNSKYKIFHITTNLPNISWNLFSEIYWNNFREIVLISPRIMFLTNLYYCENNICIQIVQFSNSAIIRQEVTTDNTKQICRTIIPLDSTINYLCLFKSSYKICVRSIAITLLNNEVIQYHQNHLVNILQLATCLLCGCNFKSKYKIRWLPIWCTCRALFNCSNLLTSNGHVILPFCDLFFNFGRDPASANNKQQRLCFVVRISEPL